MSDIEGFKEKISTQWRTVTPDKLAFVQGRYDGLEQIANYETFIAGLKAFEINEALEAAQNV